VCVCVDNACQKLCLETLRHKLRQLLKLKPATNENLRTFGSWRVHELS